MNRCELERLARAYERCGWEHAVQTIYSVICDNERLRAENARLREQQIDAAITEGWAVDLLKRIAKRRTESGAVDDNPGINP